MLVDKKLIFGVIILVVLFAIILVVTNPQPTGLFGLGEKEKYKVGIILPTTGLFADYGKNALDGLEIISEEVDNIEIILGDNQSDIKTAVSEEQKLINVDKVDALITFQTSVSSALAPIAQESKVLMLYSSSITKPAKQNDYVFVNYINIEQDCKAIAKIFRGKKGAIIGHNFEATLSCIRGFNEEGIVLNSELIDKLQTDFKTQIAKALSGNPDFLVLRGDDKTTPLLMKQIKELNYSGFQIICPHSYGAGCQNKEMLLEYNDYFKGAIGTDQYVGESKELNEFKEKYKNKFNKEPGEWSFVIYEDIKILSKALGECKGESECTRNYISANEFSGLEGKMKFNSERAIEKSTNFVIFDGNNWVSK